MLDAALAFADECLSVPTPEVGTESAYDPRRQDASEKIFRLQISRPSLTHSDFQRTPRPCQAARMGCHNKEFPWVNVNILCKIIYERVRMSKATTTKAGQIEEKEVKPFKGIK